MDSFIRFIGVIAGSGLLTWFTFEPIGRLYLNLFKPSGFWGFGGEVAVIAGIPATFLFFCFMGIVLFWHFHKWFLYIIPGVVVLLTSVYIDPIHFYFPLVFGFIGLGLGLLVRRLYEKYITHNS